MKRALQVLICAVTMIGCARALEIPLEPVESDEPRLVEGEPARLEENAAVAQGAAGMSGGCEPPSAPDTEPPPVDQVPSQDAGAGEPPVDPVPSQDAGLGESPCTNLSALVARDGAITFNEDGSATVSVALANTSDHDVFDYPGLSVRWEVQWRYASGDAGDLMLYGLWAGDHYEYTFQAPADVLQRGSGGLMIVHAQPFTLWARDSGLGCEGATYQFSAMVP